MKKDYYLIIKNELKNRRENIKYFNRAFFKMYLQVIQARENHIKAGTLDAQRYTDGLVIKYRYYNPVYNSNFYIKNGPAYCEFLAVFLDYEKQILNAV